MNMSLTELLQQSQAQFAVYDLGRRVTPIAPAVFAAVEAQQRPYPYPIQQHACFAIAFWQTSTTPFIWFLKIPVDERGLLDLAVRDDFCRNVLTLLGNQITGSLTEAQQQQLQNAPALFTPSDEKKAAFNAQLKADLKQPPSIYFESAQAYLQQHGEPHPKAPDDWRQLGLQGIHDVIARLAQDLAMQKAIVTQFGHYPAPLQQAIATALEHQQLAAESYQVFEAQLATELSKDQTAAGIPVINLLRAQAGNQNPDFIALLQQLLEQGEDQLNADMLVVIAGRLYTQLAQPGLLEAYFVAVARQQDPALFAGLFSDLVSLPDLRVHLLQLLQRNDLPQVLFQAVQQLRGLRA